MSAELGVKHGAEFRRCLLECDVRGLIAVHQHIAPYDTPLSPRDATISMHMARADVPDFPRKVRQYSAAWLKDHGYVKEDGQWRRSDALEQQVFAEGVGISSSTISGHKYKLHHDIERGMSDVLLNAIAKGIHDAPHHTEIMQKERMRIRFKNRI